jgi:hypothetical protein
MNDIEITVARVLDFSIKNIFRSIAYDLFVFLLLLFSDQLRVIKMTRYFIHSMNLFILNTINIEKTNQYVDILGYVREN